MKKNSNKRIICLIIFLLLLPILIIAFYNHPNFDDYAYSIDTFHTWRNNEGFLSLIVCAFKTSYRFMYNWQGLYSSAVLLSLQPAIFGEKFYSLTTFLMIIILFIGLYLFIHSIFKYILKSNISAIENCFFSLIILFFLIETAPSAREMLFWFNGSMNYLFFWSLMLIIFSMAIGYFCNCKFRFKYLLVFSLFSFVLSGGNHVTAFGGILIELFFVILSFLYKKRTKLIFPLLVGMLGFAINIMAPGTRIRANTLNVNQSVFDTVYKTFLKSFELFSNWFSLSLIAFTIVVVIFMWKYLDKIKINYNKKYLFIPLFSYLLIAGMMCVPYYALGNFGAGRVYNTLYFTFVLLFLGNVLLFIKYLHDKRILCIEKIHIFNHSIIAIICIVFIGIIGNNFYYFSTSYEAVSELLSGEAKKFSDQTYERVKLLEDDEVDEVIVKPYKYKPYLLFNVDYCEINKDNKCNSNPINKYYNKKVVAIDSK